MAKELTIYLNTPLAQSEGRMAGDMVITRLRGTVMDGEGGGITLQVKEIGNDKGWQSTGLPFKKILVPIHKIDFAVYD